MVFADPAEQLESGRAMGELPKVLRDILTKARTSWLRNQEVVDLLSRHRQYGFRVSKEPPQKPPGGSLFLFNRKSVRFFRKDGHDWRKKSDGKTVRETHEKLKVGNKDVLNCYYAHAEDSLQRRCYWLLEGDDNVVLVHYLSSNPQENCVMRGPPPNGGALSLNAVEIPRPAPQQPSLVSAWQYPGASAGLAQASYPVEPVGRTGSLGTAGSMQAAAAQPRSFVVTTGDVVRSSSGHLEQPDGHSQSSPSGGSSQQMPTPFARQGSHGLEQSGAPGPPIASVGTPRRDDGMGAFSRAASMPTAALARSASGQHEDTVRLGTLQTAPSVSVGTIQMGLTMDATDCCGRASARMRSASAFRCHSEQGPLHTAPSFSGGTVQTGLTMDATELQRARSGAAAAASSSGQLPGDLPPSKLQRHGSSSHASSLEQQRHMVPALRLQMKDAQGEQRDVLRGLLSLQDADVALPLDTSGASCRLSRDTSSTLAGSLARRGPATTFSNALKSPALLQKPSSNLARGLGWATGSSFGQQWSRQAASYAGRGLPLASGQPPLPAVTTGPTL